MGRSRPGSMVSRASPAGDRGELRGAAAGVVAGLGAFFLVRNVGALLGTLSPDLLRAVPHLLLSLSLVYAGLWLLRCDLPNRRVGHVALWSVAGFAALVALTLWIVGDVGGLALDRGALLAVDLGTVGASTGLLVGLASERDRRRSDRSATDAALAAERAEDRFAHFNRILRHHVLNGLAVVRGQAELLEEDAEEPPEEVAIIRRRTDEMADLVRNVETLGRAFTGDLARQPVDPIPAVETAVESVSGKHPDVEFHTTLAAAPRVLANERLHLVFEAVLGVAADAAEDGRVRVTARGVGDELVLSLAFDGTMRIGGRGGSSVECVDEADLGRFLAESLLEYFGGGLVVREGECERVMTVRLPGAE